VPERGVLGEIDMVCPKPDKRLTEVGDLLSQQYRGHILSESFSQLPCLAEEFKRDLAQCPVPLLTKSPDPFVITEIRNGPRLGICQNGLLFAHRKASSAGCAAIENAGLSLLQFHSPVRASLDAPAAAVTKVRFDPDGHVLFSTPFTRLFLLRFAVVPGEFQLPDADAFLFR
jgi:hypothetical protein